MKTNQDENHGIKSFGELGVFDLFLWCGAWYMKSKKVGFLNAVRLSDGDMHGFNDFERIKPVDGALFVSSGANFMYTWINQATLDKRIDRAFTFGFVLGSSLTTIITLFVVHWV